MRHAVSAAPGSPPTGHASAGRLVLRNTAFLAIARALTTPLSLLVNVVAARRLGPQDFGWIYLASTFLSLAFLLVEWGQAATLAGLIARQRARARAAHAVPGKPSRFPRGASLRAAHAPRDALTRPG